MRQDASSIEQPTQMNEELAWFLGFLWGDGAMSPSRYRLRFTSGDRSQLDKVCRVARNQFGLDVEISETSGTRKCWEVCIASKHLWHWLIKNDVWKYHADDIDLIPRIVRRSSRRDILGFISGLIDADGCAHFANKRTDRRGKFTISTASQRFAQHVQDVCWAVGIAIGCSHNTGGQNKQQRKSMYLLTSAAEQVPESWEVLERHSLKLSAMAADPEFEGWQWGAETRGYVLGRVTGVEEIGEMPTFDVEVDQTHWYYAGAVKSHNTVSLLAGATPGVHWDHSPHYIRRIRVQEGHDLIDMCREAGYPVEQDKYSDNTMVISFPVKVDSMDRRKTEVSLREKVDLAAQIQHYWADNQVSCTAEFDPDTEADEIPRILAAYEDRLKGISFLPMRDHGYEQAPYEEISEETFEQMRAKIKPLQAQVVDTLAHDQEDKFCDGEACKID